MAQYIIICQMEHTEPKTKELITYLVPLRVHCIHHLVSTTAVTI